MLLHVERAFLDCDRPFHNLTYARDR
jgi:hypothetical protein